MAQTAPKIALLAGYVPPPRSYFGILSVVLRSHARNLGIENRHREKSYVQALGYRARDFGLLLSWSAVAAPQKAADAKPFVFIGFSINTVASGGVGLPMMNETCQTDFDRLDARIATTKEYIESTNTDFPPVAGPFGAAWIHPIFIAVLADGRRMEFTGVITSISLDCNLWTDGTFGPIGLSVNTSGGIENEFCNETLRVACSARGQ